MDENNKIDFTFTAIDSYGNTTCLAKDMSILDDGDGFEKLKEGFVEFLISMGYIFLKGKEIEFIKSPID